MSEKSEKDCDIEKGIFGFEITTTQACNYSCSYCFERNHKPEKKLLNAFLLIKKIKDLLSDDWFKEQYSGIKIILWGGEPTLNFSLCKVLMEKFKDDERVCFFIYTNGSTIDKMMPIFKELKKKHFVKKGMKKLTVQISYDGDPIHDKNRKDKDGNETSSDVIYAIGELHRYDIEYGLKATMSWDDFYLMPRAWDDFKILHDKFGSKIRYALTVDYYNVEFDKYKDKIVRALLQVAARELKFYKKYGYFLSNIFRSNRAFCATGKSMLVVDTNGDVYYCHGAIYSKCSEEFKYNNIFDKNFINNIRKANRFFYNNQYEPEECKECVASQCLRCNVKKYEESNKESFKDRWYDYPAQKDLCEYYKLVGKIGAAMGFIIKD